jgi:hypothetical protein
MMPAPLAGISGFLAQFVKPPFAPALGASGQMLETDLHEVVETSLIVGKLIEKILDGQLPNHASCVWRSI